MVYNKLKSLLPSRIQYHLATVKRYRQTSLKNLTEYYSVRKVASGRYLDEAKELHATIYLKHKFVTEADILPNGYLSERVDPYENHADYFVVIDKERDEVVALVRQIHRRSGDHLPVMQHTLTNKPYHHIHNDDIVEVSAFAKKSGVDSRVTLMLFAEMLRYSQQMNHRYWVFACDSRVYRQLKTLFGRLLQRTGPEVFYMGSKVIPAEVDLDNALRQLRTNHRYSLPPLRQVRRFLYDSLRSFSYQSEEPRLVSRTAFWDSYAKAYDGLLHLEPYCHLVDHVSDLAIEHRPQRVLDLGCGTGNVAIAVLKKDTTLQVDAVDWSRAMLAVIPQKTSDSRLTIRRFDILHYLSTTHHTYDTIILTNVVYTVRERQLFWELIARRLNKGGRVIVADPDTGNSSSLVRNHIETRSFVSLLRPRLIAIGMFDSVISFLGMAKQYSFTPQEELLKEVEGAGLHLEGDIGRCYGGHERGIDLLFTLKKR